MESRTVRAAVEREANIALQRDRREEVIVRALVDRDERSWLPDRENEVRLRIAKESAECASAGCRRVRTGLPVEVCELTTS